MIRLSLLPLIASSSLAFAQVELQFPCNSCNNLPTTPTYTGVLRLPNGDRLFVGQSGLYQPPQHVQIALMALGPAQFNPPLLGGSANDTPQAAAVDPSGNLWLVGYTNSDDFRLTNPIIASKIPYAVAAFVIEIDPTGKLLFSTYLAGLPPQPSPEYSSFATALAFDSAGNAYIGGSTDDPYFPTTGGAYLGGKGDMDLDGSYSYSFLVKISPAGELVYATELQTGASDCFGGSACIGHESTSASVTGLFVDSTGAATVAGLAGGAFDPGGGYVSRVAPNGSSLLWSTSVALDYGAGAGGTSAVTSLFIAPDLSPPVDGGAQGEQPIFTGNVDLFGAYAPVIDAGIGPNVPPGSGIPGLFAAQLTADGQVGFSVDLGQSADAHADGMVTDASGNIYLAGTSSSSQLAPPAGVPNIGSDFLLELDSTGSQLQPPLHLSHGAITAPPALDTTSGLSLMLLGSQNALLIVPANYSFDNPTIVAFANSASLALNTGLYPGALLTLYGFDFPASAQGLQVLINGTPAPLLFVSPTQINLQVPFETSTADAPQLQLIWPSGEMSVQLSISRSPGIFTVDGLHAAALNADGTVNSPANPAAAGSLVSLFGTGGIWPSGMQDGAVATAALQLSYGNEFEALGWFQGPVNLIQTPLYISYAGAAPGLIDGVFQVNVQLPPGPAQPGLSSSITLQSGTPGYSVASNTVYVYTK